MKIIVIEDEHMASKYLKSILEKQSIISISEITLLKSVKDSVAFFAKNSVDLAFMDIHLRDGKSLEIFEQATVSCPVIFTTAYDSYALKVFKHFTIDYLLKPYQIEDLYEALLKYKSIKENFNTNLIVESLVEIENQSSIQHHFLVNHRDKLLSINDTAVAYFFATGKHMFIYTDSDNIYRYNNNLTDLAKKLNPVLFFKINRKYIINRCSVKDVIKHSSQIIEILLNVQVHDTEPIILSRRKINNFKNWLDS